MLVVKIGGAAGVDLGAVCDDIAVERRRARDLIVVHGGSDDTNKLSEALGRPARFVTSVSGQQSRLTDRPTLDIYLMATAAVNRRLVEMLQARGVNAFGLSGLDGGLVRGVRKDMLRVIENGRQRIIRDDWTGTPELVDVALLRVLMERGLVPVIAPVAISAKGEPLNVDGDRLAALVASSLGAETLLLLTNVVGLLRKYPDESTLIRHVPKAAIAQAAAAAEGRMKKKVMGADEALQAGVGRVIIASSRRGAPISEALRGEGTVFGAPLDGAATSENAT